MKKLLVVIMALAFAAGMAYAAEGKKAVMEPVTTIVDDTGATVETAAEGVVDTASINRNEPVTTAVKSTVKVAEAGVKTVTLQKVDKPGRKSKGAGCSK